MKQKLDTMGKLLCFILFRGKQILTYLVNIY